MSEWISVSNRVPENDNWIQIGSSITKRVDIGIYMNGKFVQPDLNYFELKDTTHWMAMTEPPKENDG